MDTLSAEDFDAWLSAYGAAWEARDPAAAVRLFTEDALYHWTPFGPPKEGHEGIAAAWGEATSRQRDVEFRYEIWCVSGRTGIAKWHARFTRIATGRPVEIDGVLQAELDGSGACRVFREWWHSSESERAVPHLPADDLRVAKDFYVSKLGFEVLFEEASDDGRSGILGLARGAIRITVDSPMEGHGRNACVSLEVDDADAYFEEWRRRADVLRPPKNETWGARTFDLLDPFGNTIFVIGPTKEEPSA